MYTAQYTGKYTYTVYTYIVYVQGLGVCHSQRKHTQHCFTTMEILRLTATAIDCFIADTHKSQTLVICI